MMNLPEVIKRKKTNYHIAPRVIKND